LPGLIVFAGVQLLVVVFSTLHTGGSPKVQHDFEHVVDSQLWTTPLMVFCVLTGLPQLSAPHCFSAPSAAIGTTKHTTNPRSFA
jgi:hypothetical protein